MLLKVQSYTNYQRRNDISFKNKMTFDVGASDPRGTLKILVEDNDGADLFEYKGYVNDTTKGFKDEEHFVERIARAMNVQRLIEEDAEKAKAELNGASEKESEKLEKKIKDLRSMQETLDSQSSEERKITGFALLLPGTIQKHVAILMANLRKTDGKSLENVDLDKVISKAKENGDVELVDNADFIPAKDLAGTGLGVASRLINHPIYGPKLAHEPKGFHAVAVQTGGGFGSVDIKFISDTELMTETNECSHDLFHDEETKTEKRLGELGPNTKGVITNFAKELGIENEDDIKALVKTGMGQIATQPSIILNKAKDNAAIKVLLNTGIYEIANDGSETMTLAVKQDNGNMINFYSASKTAINKYATAIALHAVTKINNGANLVILSGPLAMGLNKTIKANPEIFKAEDLRELVLKKVEKRLGKDNTAKSLRISHEFDIVCDKDLSVDNNTFGGSLLLAGKTKTYARKGEWITVSIDTLKNPKE